MIRLPGPHADTLGHICAACRVGVHSSHAPDRNDGAGHVTHCCCEDVRCNPKGGYRCEPPF